MRKLLVLVASFALFTVTGGVATSVSATNVSAKGDREPTVVRTEGEGIFHRNALIAETLRFSPGTIWVKSGSHVRFVHDDATSDPHTMTIVKRGDRPSSFDEVFACGQSPSDPCSNALGAHFGGPTPVFKVNHGSPGFDRPGDSLLLCPVTDPQQQSCGHGAISWFVSAPAGSTLYFICVIHPWMQGVIHVT